MATLTGAEALLGEKPQEHNAGPPGGGRAHFDWPRFARELAGALVQLACYLAVPAAFAAAVLQVLPRYFPATAAAVPPVSTVAWSDVARPHPAFALVMSEFAGTESHYVIRHHPLGGRKDIMSFGDLGGSAPHLKIEIYRAGGEQGPFAGVAREIGARVADLDPAEQMQPSGTLETKFGRLALVDFMVNPVSGPRRCLGFARAFPHPTLQIAGTYCQAGPKIVDRGVLACALDRLTFTAGRAEPKLAELFAEAEVKRSFCGHKGPILAATPKAASWIESARDSMLRGSVAVQ